MGGRPRASPARAEEVSGAEADPVVQEVEVYLNDQSGESIYLVQYPLKPFCRTPQTPTWASFKPERQILELDFPIDGHADYFDSEAPEEQRRSTLHYQSTSVPFQSFYAVARYASGAFHLLPVRGILQMRPNRKYLDTKVQNPVADEEEMRELKVSFSKIDVKRPDTMRMNYPQLQALNEAEPSVNLRPYGIGSPESRAALEMMGQYTSDQEYRVLTLGPYLESLRESAVTPDAAMDHPHASGSAPPAASARNSFENRLLQLVSRAKYIYFDEIPRYLSGPCPEEQLLAELPKIALYVQGAFVARSQYLCDPEDALYRNLILYHFSQSPTVTLPELQFLRILPSHLEKLLSSIAERDTESHCWRFAAPPSDSFQQSHPEAHAQLVKGWKALQRAWLKDLADGESRKGRRTSEPRPSGR